MKMKGQDPEEFVEKQEIGDFTSVMVNFYRGEMQRAYTWRRRLDRTTEWSIVILSALTTWTFSSPGRRDELLLSVLIFMGTLLWIEARRYRHYNVLLGRIKTLEENFIAKTLDPGEGVSTREWMKTLAEDLKHPQFKIPIWIAIGHRLRRVYIWLISLTLMLWLTKVVLHPIPASNLGVVFNRASIIGIPGYVIFSLIGAVLVLLILIAVLSTRHERKGVKIVEKKGTDGEWDKMT
ncbi:MAG: DUF2270 domain-containing protein [Candidatus Thermoplasmatota archaeon]